MGGCIEFVGPKDRDGYGRIYFGTSGPPPKLAHRAAYEQCLGPIPRGLCVLHSCDNPPCVNPDHLFLGTNLDNIRDRDRKGRTAKGATHYKAKLTDGDVRHVRELIDVGESDKAISKIFGVVPATIWWIRTGKTWRSN